MRHRLPGLAAEKLPQFGVEAMWVYHPLVSARLARICDLAEIELIAWTVDELPQMREARRRRRRRHLLQRPPPVLAPRLEFVCSLSVSDNEKEQTKGSDRARRGGRRGCPRLPRFTFTADSSSSVVKPPTASPSSA